jgi:hypothetical protein
VAFASELIVQTRSAPPCAKFSTLLLVGVYVDYRVDYCETLKLTVSLCEINVC